MYGATGPALIISGAGFAQTVAVLVGAVALGIGAFLYATHRTAVLRTYLVFLTAIFLFVLSFWFREIGIAISTVASGGIASGTPAAGPAAVIMRTLSAASLLAEATGGIALVLVLPRLTHGLFYLEVPAYRTGVAVVTAVAMATAVLTIVAAPNAWAPIALMSMMYATVAVSIGELAVRSGRQRGTPPSPAQGSNGPGDDTVRAIRVFLVVSAAFLPLFVADVVISSPGAGTWARHPFVRALDDLSVPLYCIVLAAGSVRFAYRFLNEPPLMVDEQISDFGRERYALTNREIEVVEYIVEGFSVADAATAMKISPKTVENHLYAVYQKTGVTNRIQLYNLFENRRRL